MTGAATSAARSCRNNDPGDRHDMLVNFVYWIGGAVFKKGEIMRALVKEAARFFEFRNSEMAMSVV